MARTSRWSEHDRNLLSELIHDHPPTAVASHFNKKADRRRSPKTIKTYLQREGIKALDEYPDHVSRKGLAVGLGIQVKAVYLWERWKGLKKAPWPASNPKYVYYRKTELRRFFREHPECLSNATIACHFAQPFVEILSGEW